MDQEKCQGRQSLLAIHDETLTPLVTDDDRAKELVPVALNFSANDQARGSPGIRP